MTHTGVLPTEVSRTPAPRRRRWPLVYFALAAFDVCAVLASLYLNHALVRMHAASLDSNQRWTARRDRYTELQRLAAAAGESPTNVFDSRDARMETVKLRAARRAFDAALAQARAELESAPDAEQLATLEPALRTVLAAMNTVSAEANMALTYFAIDDLEQAGEYVASTNRAMANVQAAFIALERTSSEIHAKLFARQLDLAAAVGRVDAGIALAVVLMVAGASFWGRKLMHEAARFESERERHLTQMARAKESAESATRAKSAFLANVSHEIRTPMNVIIGMTEMALDGELPAESRECLATVRRATVGLVAIVNDILDCSKIEAGKVTLEAVDVNLHTLVDEVAQVLGPHAREKGLALACTLDPEVPQYVEADPLRLQQVLTNLVENAIKFTEAGGVMVEVAALGRATTHARVRFAVRDTGIGVPIDRQAVIFESFTQVDDSTTRTYGGTGLGLSICRQLVELMGGRIGIESAVGKGSTFWFEVALAHTDGSRARDGLIGDSRSLVARRG